MYSIKKENGMGHIQVLLLIIIITCLVASGIYFIRTNLNDRRIETIKTNMMLIQWKVKNYMGSKTVAKEEAQKIGTKISEMKEDKLLKEIIDNGVIKEDEYEKYYVLKDEDLAAIGTEVTHEEDSYYIVNYDTEEIIFSKGCSYNKGEKLYKLSEIENAKNNKEENKQAEESEN